MSAGRVIAVIGKIASGKSTYCERLLRDNGRAILLSIDEVYWHLFRNNAGELHDRIAPGVREYLLAKSKDVVNAGCDAVLDWGFWRKDDRLEARCFFEENGIECSWRYLRIDRERQLWQIEKRNREVSSGASKAYYVDEGLWNKSERLFEEPDESEYDECISLHREGEDVR